MPSLRPVRALRRPHTPRHTIARRVARAGRAAAAAPEQNKEGSPSRLPPAPTLPPIPITFLPSGVTTAAPPGTNMMDVASAAGVDLPGGCFSGSCGLCEVEVSTRDLGGALLADALVQRACVAVIPAGGVASVVIAELADDAVWGQDGWDT